MNSLPYLKITMIMTFIGIPYRKGTLRFYPQNVSSYHSYLGFSKIYLMNGVSFVIAMNAKKYEDTIAGYNDFLIKAQREAMEKVNTKKDLRNKLNLH